MKRMSTTSCVPCIHYKKDFNTEPCKSCKDHNKQEQGLKPCPFCGDTPPVEDPYTFYANQGEKWGHVLCGCGACGPEVRTEYKPLPHWKDAAIAGWNNRKP